MSEIDTRYDWLTLMNICLSGGDDYFSSLGDEIKRSGSIDIVTDIGTVKSYTAELSYILTTEELLCRNMDKDRFVKMDNQSYLEVYSVAFFSGVEYVVKTYKIEHPKKIPPPNLKLWIESVRRNYFQTFHSPRIPAGWNSVRDFRHYILKESLIREFGYYSGMVSEIDKWGILK